MQTRIQKIVVIIGFLLFLILQAPVTAAVTPAAAHKATDYGQLPLRFEANIGQTDRQVRYISRGNGYTMYFMQSEIAMTLDARAEGPEWRVGQPLPISAESEIGVVHIRFKGCETNTIISSEQTLAGKMNYLTGNDPSLWKTGIRAFGRVRYKDLYPGVDAVFYGNQTLLEYDFQVAPMRDVAKIQLELDGAQQVKIEANGDLAFYLQGRITRFYKPVAYQIINGARQDVAVAYRLKGSQVGFTIGKYDKNYTLVIDPVLCYSTFFGGTKLDYANGVAVDGAGRAYIAGNTTSLLTNLITAGAFQTNYEGGSSGGLGDVFVGCIDSTGTNLIYCTYIGGTVDDVDYGLTVDSVGHAYVCGTTDSTNFPTKNPLHYGSFDGSKIGGSKNGTLGVWPIDGFVAELETNGGSLIFSTYFGGTSWDWAESIALDSSNDIYFAGFTQSSNLPVTPTAILKQLACTNNFYVNQNAFVAEISPSGSNLLYCTYLGGTNIDEAYGIAVDSSNYVYVCGETISTNFPTTNAFSTLLNGNGKNSSTYDGFVTKFQPGCAALVYSTYLGGNNNEQANSIGADANGNAYVVGLTYSTNFPTTNALKGILNGDNDKTVSDAFITKISATGQLLYSTFLGGSNTDIATGVAVQSDGEAVVVGQTGSIDFAPYVNYGSINSGGLDAFVAKISSDGQILENFAYLGGAQLDCATSVAIDKQNNVYIAGYTGCTNFPITITNVVDPNYLGGTDAFLAKLYFEPNQLGTEVYSSWQASNAWQAIGPAATLASSNTWAAASQIASISSNGVTSLLNEWFQRGASYDPTYTSFVIPLNQQTGYRLDDAGNNSEKFNGSFPWFTRLQSDTRTHLSLIASTNISGSSTNYYGYVTNFNNPIAAFGATAGQSPLYVNEQFKFGVYCGAQYETTNINGTNFAAPLRVLVYNMASFTNGQTNVIAPFATNYIAIPRRTIAADSTNWLRFATNGFAIKTNANGLRTTVQLVVENGGAWGVVPQFTNEQNGTYIITHECTTNLGYGYVIEGIGVVPLATNLYPMVTNSAGAVGWDRLYSLDFETLPPWRSVFIDQPQFDGAPLPPFYQGASLDELTNLNAVVTNSIPLIGSAYTTVDDSPELRRHPLLDQLVANLNNDPVAIANYVINNIELTDALAYNENNGQASAPSVNEGGVDRSALDVYMEGQGSPVEQCALLVYLLRQAGYPAAFIFPTNNNVQMLDTRLSALLRMQLHGAVNQYGQLYTTNSLITVNYPWVVTTISNQTIHIFPWLKDTQVTEGLNLYDYMPTNYDSGFKWLQNYIYGDTNILGLSAESDAPDLLFPRFVKQQLSTTAPGISLSDIGIQAFDRQHYYSRWQDFPTPSVVNTPTNVACADCLANLGSVILTMTNVFNTVTLAIASQNTPGTQMSVGPLRMCDLHNREMFMATNGANGLMLWLAPYISGNTNISAFNSSDPALTNEQTAILTITTNDQSFNIQITHYHHQDINFSPSNQFLSVSEVLQYSTPLRPFNLQDITAICFNVGRVTPAMIDVHAQAFQQMSYQWSLNTNSVPAVSDYQAAAAYMMGMDYYSHVSQFLTTCEQLHKVQVVSWFAEGLSRLTPVQLGSQNFMRPSMDMFYSEMAHAGNGTSHPDSGDDTLAGTDDFTSIMESEIAAQEHNIVNGYYQSQNSVSAIVLLRLAQQRAGSGTAGIIELNRNNYQTVGATNSPGYGPTKLQLYDSVIWAAVTNAFSGWDADYVRAYITPGPVSLAAADYRGMGLVIVGEDQSASLISVNMNGVQGADSLFFGDTPASLSTAYSLGSPSDEFSSSYYGNNLYFDDSSSSSGSANFDYYWTTPDWFDSDYAWPYVMPVDQYRITATFTPPSQINLAQQINDLNNYPSSTPVQTSLTHALDSGNTGSSVWHNLENYVYDPVSVLTGEFYHDTVDLTVAGPQPLQLRRNYSSLNQDDRNGFGYGWDINVVPYIGITTNATTNVVLTAVELDGSVIAYRQQTNNLNLYTPVTADNLELDNNGNGHIGSIYNPFNAKIIHSFSGTNELYTLTQSDGQIRTYTVNSFPVNTLTNVILRQRPYLTTWKDTQGNSWTFTYGTNSTLPNYGSVIRIQSSNGNYIGLDYNAGGYVIDAYTSAGERTDYEYDDFGDLILVTRPDASQEAYQYQHTIYTNNGTVYVDSTHLLTFEFKPDGRVLQNVYDSLRRVTNQLATVGADLNLYTNAVFTYSNNFALTQMTNGINGYTVVKDVNGNTNRYDYRNSLVMTNTDALGQRTIQTWYADTNTVPGFPRSLYQTRDKRGLWSQFQYDINGNLTNSFSWGDLTGDGTTQYATNTATYNGNNLPTSFTDPIGNTVLAVYSPKFPYLVQFAISAPAGTPTVTNEFDYGSLTNIVVNGSLTFTDLACGVLTQEIRAVNSPDAATNQWSFDGRGYLTQATQFTGNADPAIVNYFTCNDQGEIIERIDSARQRFDYAYDDIHRPISREIYSVGQTQPMFWEYAYYNGNGQLTWYDGPGYNPEDYQYFDYDGAGRLTTSLRWRAEAKADGSGVQAPAGYNLYAQSFNQYDKFGNLVLAVDPRGAIVTNNWDKLGQLIEQQHLDTNGITVLSSEGYAYEPGGQVQYFTNALSGVTAIAYTTNGLPKYRSNPDGSTNAWHYYLDGRLKTELQGNGAYWQTTYNDVNRITTRIFYTAAGVSLATNSVQLDRRGNAIQFMDAGGNMFTISYDDLDRVKVFVGPAGIVQTFTNFYDAAGLVTTNVNALGESVVTSFDTLKRPIGSQIYSASNTLVRQSSMAYSPDFHSVTVTNGIGANAIVSTTYNNNDGQTVLSIASPSSSLSEFMLNQFDLAGNLIGKQHNTVTGGTVTTWTTASFAYDGLNRLINKTDRDGALTTYGFDSFGDATNCSLPGGLQWISTYNNAGLILSDWCLGGSLGMRTNSYVYFASNSPFAGLLQVQTDGRKTTNNFSYDDWLRATNISSSGKLAEQNVTTAYTYDPRGFMTNITEAFANTNTGPTTIVTRSFDAYGQLASESVNVGTFSYSASQGWDAAGRRNSLTLGPASYSFGWQADDSLVFASNPAGSGSYIFDTSGLLDSRSVGNHLSNITSRDGTGRPLSISSTVNLLTELTESLTWSGDGLLSTHNLNRTGSFSDSRAYSYANLSRRLTQEQLNLNALTAYTNSFVYDSGTGGGAGVLTSMGQLSQTSGLWTGSSDALLRVKAETNNSYAYSAYGHVSGQATLNGWLDSNPITIAGFGTNAMQWRASMDLSPGPHQLTVAASDPTGSYTSSTTNSWFTNSIAYQASTNTYDGAGNVTNRVWKNPSGAVERTQSLSWDARGRLHQIIDRDSKTNGYNWMAVYDALNRRLSTTVVLVTNGVAYPASSQTLNSYFDPLAEFLELGVQNGSQTTWKLCGPDLDGTYGDMNGIGGLDAVSPNLSQFNPVISDAQGNILAEITNGTVAWNPSRSSAYGAVPGYQPPSFGSGADMAEASAWGSHWPDITGYYNQGRRVYDPISGRWLSFDPAWNGADPSGFTYCGGDPMNYFDPNGRLGKQAIQQTTQQSTAFAAWVDDTAINTVLGTGVLLQEASGKAMEVIGGDPSNFYWQANHYQSWMSPYARAGYYNPNKPAVQLATDATILLPGALPSRVGFIETSFARNFVANVEDVNATTLNATAAEATAARTASGDFYSVAFQTKLAPTSYPGVSRYMHFKEANSALDAEMQSNPLLSELGISVPKSPSGTILGKAPTDWVWHHDAEAGVMQLVPKAQHPNIPVGIFWDTMHPGGVGGFSIWGQ